jgi:hypothetical protein
MISYRYSGPGKAKVHIKREWNQVRALGHLAAESLGKRRRRLRRVRTSGIRCSASLCRRWAGARCGLTSRACADCEFESRVYPGSSSGPRRAGARICDRSGPRRKGTMQAFHRARTRRLRPLEPDFGFKRDASASACRAIPPFSCPACSLLRCLPLVDQRTTPRRGQLRVFGEKFHRRGEFVPLGSGVPPPESAVARGTSVVESRPDTTGFV